MVSAAGESQIRSGAVVGTLTVSFNGTGSITLSNDVVDEMNRLSAAGGGTLYLGAYISNTLADAEISFSRFDLNAELAPAPTISNVSPNRGPSGSNVVINGSNLSGASAVTFGGTPSSSVTVLDSTRLAVRVPSGLRAGDVLNVVVTTPGGVSSEVVNFTVDPMLPVIGSISPSDGPMAGGTRVTVSGANFEPGTTTVTIGSATVAAADLTVNSATSLSFLTPASGVGGNVSVKVTTSRGESDPAPGGFTYVGPPVVYSISPTSGPTGGGTQVVITGNGFSALTVPGNGTVKFGTIDATYTVDSLFQITAIAPPGSAGPVHVTAVSTSGGASPTSAADLFTYVAAAQTISFGPLGNASLSASPLTLSATASSGLTVAFASTTQSVCTVTGTSLTLLMTGLCTIDADQAGDASNGRAATVTRSFTVLPAFFAMNAQPSSSAKVGVGYSQANTATGGVGPYTYSIAQGPLPAGTTLDPATGVVSGTPTTTGRSIYQIKATDSQATPANTVGPFVDVTIAKGDQTLAFTSSAPAAKVGDAAYAVIAITTSGLAVSYSLDATSTGCALAGTSVTFTAPGTCVINADQAGDSNWNAATRVQQSFTVARAPLTGNLSGNTNSWKVGDSYRFTFAISGGVPPYTFASSDLPAGTTIDAITGVVSGTLTTAGDIGYNVLIADSAGAQLVARPIAFIAKGVQTLSFTSSATPASVGGAAYAVSATASSGLAVSYALDATSTGCALSGTRVTFTTIGTCRINADQAGDSNWNAATQAQQSFAVGAADAVGVSIGFTPSALAVGATGALTLTFDNPNSANTPAFGVTLTSPALLTRVSGAPGGTCTTGPASNPSSTTVALGGIVAPPGRCTVTLAYAGAVAGAASGFTLDAFAPTGYSTTSMAMGSGVTVAPTVTGVSPNTGPAGQVVTISGAGFSTTLADNIVRFGGSAGTVTTANATSLTVNAPATGSGSVAVTVTVNGQASAGSATYTFIDMPVAADRSGVAVAYGSSGAAIDLSGAITGGPHGSIAIVRAPARGGVSIAGDVVTYTPASGAYGADSFTYTATGPGGVSNIATVSLTVAAPPAPVVADKSVEVVYGSAGATIDLSSAISGGGSGAITIGKAPAHGGVSVAGYVVTYIPAADYFGDDSFTYTASGPGGVSNAATVSLTVTTPSAPVVANKAGVELAYGSAGVSIDLSGVITGVHSSIAIAKGPAHGVVTIKDQVATYTPTTGYYGVDGFTFTATGPGGTSAPASVSLTVVPPPPPVAGSGPINGGSVNAGSSLTLDLAALVTGVYDTILISSPPAHGVVTLSGVGSAAPSESRLAAIPQPPYIATFTPAAGFAGVDSFAFVAVGPGGASAPASVTITVVGQVPTAPPARTATTGDGQGVSVMLTDGAAGGPFVAAAVVSVSPVDSAKTAIVASGSGPGAAYRLDVTPNNRFDGKIVVVYTLSNAYGASAPSTVTLTVQARPDPRNDPDIGAMSDAQAETTRRFARAQVSNFMRRNEQLHHGGGRAGATMGVTLSAPYAPSPAERPRDENWERAMAERMRVWGQDPNSGRVGDTAPGRPPVEDNDVGGGDGQRLIGSVASWVGGAIDIGARDATTDRSKVTARTSGLSGGADLKLRENLLVGFGGGFGDDLNKIGAAEARVRGKSTVLAAYASYQPTESGFVDAMVGHGQLDFTTRRLAAAASATAQGKRDGDYTVAALSLGFDRGRGALQWSLYGRGEYLDARLGAYAETGAGRYNLRFDRREVESLTGTIGGTIHYRHKVGFGAITPHLRAEWNHEFADVDAQWLDYADIPGASIYSLQGSGWKREQVQLGVGARFDILKNGWSVDLEAALRAGQGERAGSLQIKLSNEF